jgi:hypothetical protein
MAINNIFTEPGVFSQFKPVRTFPVLPGGVRVAALVGAGRTTNIVNGEVVTKGAEDAADNLAHVATSLGATIVDEDFVTYNITTDYVLTGGDVAWSPAAVAFVVGTIDETFDMSVSRILKLTVAGGVEQSVDISDVGAGSGDYADPANATAAEVAAVIAAEFTGVTALDSSGKVRIETTADNNSSLLIGDGTANAVLGLTDGTLQSTPREPAPGKTYSVSYEYAKAPADYAPRFFFNMSDVQAEHGDVSTTNTLSLGAEIVFEQGASAVALVQIDPADGSLSNQFRKAIDKLAPVNDINIIVALSTDTTLHSYLKTHCATTSSITERKERTTVVAMPATPTVASLSAQATALADKRVVLVSAYSATRFVGTNLNASTLDGSFVAAAIAGVRTSRTFDVAEPLTRKEIVGFEDLTDPWMRTEKVLLLSKGVMVIENLNGVHRVMQQVTTDTSTRENNEYSVVETIDFVGANMRKILENIFIGQKILAGTPSQVRSTVATVLNNLVTSELIVEFRDIQAEVDNGDPTQINVSFQIRPVFPLNFILITFSLSPNQ